MLNINMLGEYTSPKKRRFIPDDAAVFVISLVVSVILAFFIFNHSFRSSYHARTLRSDLDALENRVRELERHR